MKDLSYYQKLKYPIELVETDSGFVASHPDLPGCASFGDTIPEAVESLNEVRELWLEGQVEAHGSAPEPRAPEDYSGRFVVRLPKWLHRVLDSESRRQACSLNNLVVSVLSFGVSASSRVASTEPAFPENWESRHEWQSEWDETATVDWSVDRFLEQGRGRKYLAALLTKMGERQRKSTKPRATESEYGESRNAFETKNNWQN
jgi:antitoxin HicB